nr:PREDICTED: uncharacterized protein LOC107075381 isoform X2 [Lepisosteus oculatus]
MSRAVLLNLLLLFPAPALGKVWINQSPGRTCHRAGGSVTFHCSILSDGEKLEDCAPYWYVPGPAGSAGPAELQDVTGAEQFRTRISVQEDMATYSFLTLAGLQEQDNNTFYCSLKCRINGKFESRTGPGSVLGVTGAPTQECHGEQGEPFPGELRVEQWASPRPHCAGGSVMLHCQISSRRRRLEECRASWLGPDPDTAPAANGTGAGGTYSWLLLTRLRANGSGGFLCSVSCRVEGRRWTVTGPGSLLNVTPCGSWQQGCGPPVLWRVYSLFAVNGLVLCAAAAMCAALLRRRLGSRRRWEVM